MVMFIINSTALNKRNIIILLLFVTLPCRAWDWWPLNMANPDTAHDTLNYMVSISGVASYGKTAPFWLQTNRHGDISASPFSGNLTAGIIKPATRPNRWYDYDFAVTLTGRLQSKTDGIIPAMNTLGTGYTNLAYAHVRLYIVDVTVGIQPEQYGVPDPMLSGGGLLYSYNAHPMPQVRVGVDQWTAFPGLYGYVEFRGGLSHQWQMDNAYIQNGFVHHKWIGGRVGGRLPVNLSYEFHHVAQWGGSSPVWGDLGNNWQSYMSAFFVRSGGVMANDQLNAQGNHIGSQIVTLDVKGDVWKVSAYWNNVFEDGPIRLIGCGMNVSDGLWGVHVSQSRWPFISGFTYEFLNTTDQSGPFHDRDGLVFGGADSYYTNSIYRNGWNYFYRTLGTPFITSPIYNSDGVIETKNNKVQSHFIGIRGDIYGYHYRAICSYTKNYGIYKITPAQTSESTGVLLEVTKHVEKAWGLDFGISLAADFGTQFGNQFGGMLTIRKVGLAAQW